MRRRSLLALPLALLAPAVLAQTDPQMDPRTDPRGDQGEPMPRRPKGDQPKRPSMSTLRYDDLSPRQRRRAQQAMARDGERDLPPDEARRRWDATPPRDRRRAAQRVARANRGDGGDRPRSRDARPMPGPA